VAYDDLSPACLSLLLDLSHPGTTFSLLSSCLNSWNTVRDSATTLQQWGSQGYARNAGAKR